MVLSFEKKQNMAKKNPSLEVENKNDMIKFSKEFSSHERSALAAEIWQLRHKYKKDLPSKNEQKRIKRGSALAKMDTIQSEYDTVEKEVQETQEIKEEVEVLKLELSEISEKIEERKQSLLKRWFGRTRTQELDEESKKKQQKLEKISRVLGTKINLESQHEEISLRLKYAQQETERIIRETEEVIIDEGWNDLTKKKISDFYGEQSELKKNWESGSRRNIKTQSIERNTIFAHGIPMEQDYALAFDKKRMINGRDMSFEERALIAVALEPALSVSSKKLEYNGEMENKNRMAYPSGLILGQGKIMMASERDTANVALGYDLKQKSSGGERLHRDIDKKLDKIEQASLGVTDTGYSEITVQRPGMCAVYVSVDKIEDDPGQGRIQQMKDVAGKLGISCVKISTDGKMRNLETNEDVTIESLLSNVKNLTPEERVQMMEDIYSKDDKQGNSLPEDIKTRLHELEIAVNHKEESIKSQMFKKAA